MEIVTPGATSLGLFVGAALVLLLVPGPAVLYIVARSIEQGRLAGIRLRSRHPHRDTRPRARRCLGAVGAARLVGGGFQHRQICGRGLSGVARPQEDLRAGGDARGRRRADAHPLCAPVSRRLHRQSVQPEDGAVLPRVPAAIRRREPRTHRDADRHSGPAVHAARLHHRRLLRARGRDRRQLAQAQPWLSQVRALCERRPVHRPRALRRLCREPQENRER